MHGVLVEACVDSVECALAAEAAGAGRIELCGNLVEGGTTPGAGAIELCVERLRIPVFVMVRPRGGDFLYSDTEVEWMRRDIVHARHLGATGVVLGLLRVDGTVDEVRTERLIHAARPLAVTFHRAFDVCRDASDALEQLVRLGVDRVLTSGQAPTAEAGIERIARLTRQAGGRIGILAGGGVRAGNVRRIVERGGVSEVHLRGAAPRPSRMAYRNPEIEFGGQAAPTGGALLVTDPTEVREVVRAANPARS